jgi:Zn-dependent M28 family amino/carboxypeptidase
MKTLLLAGAALLMPAIASAVTPMPVPGFDPARISDDIRILSSDAYEGRGPATAAERKTVDYIVARMKAAGLQPGGTAAADGTRGWTQDVPLRRSDITGRPTLSVTTGGRATALTQGKEIAVRAALTGQTAVALKDAPLVFVGYGVTAPERKWDDFKDVDVRGKIVVLLINDPDFDGGEGDFGGKAMTYYGRWTYKYEEAARRGAAGVLIVHESAPASYGWPTVTNSNTNTMFDIVRSDATKAHTPFEAWIQRDLAVELFRASGLDFERAKAAAKRADFRPMPLKTTLSASYTVATDVITSHNVLGRLEGTRRPDETVIYSAHWDHLGIGRPDAEGDRIYNGAIDNASGVAALIAMGGAFAQADRTDRSIVFMAVTAEEKGLLGSEYYAANPVYPLAKTAGVINMDSAVGPGPARNFTISGLARLELLDMLVEEGKRRGRAYTPDPRAEAGGFYRSDHFPFAKRGVPAISFGAGNDLVTGGTVAGKAWGEAYTKDKYHQPADEWSPDWDLTGTVQDLSMLFAVGRDLAGSKIWPNWSRDSEFRAARDASEAARK